MNSFAQKHFHYTLCKDTLNINGELCSSLNVKLQKKSHYCSHHACHKKMYVTYGSLFSIIYS